MPAINEECLSKYDLTSLSSEYIANQDKPIVTIKDNHIQMKYSDKCTMTYDEKSIIKEGFFRGYILRFVYDNTMHLCHPKDLLYVLVDVSKYNKSVKQKSNCDTELKNIVKLQKDIMDKSKSMYDLTYIKDQELGEIEDFIKEITTDLQAIQKQYKVFDPDLLENIRS